MAVNPPWGAFPAEQYLIRHWDESSALPADSQRHNLIHQFLQLDTIPREWDATADGIAIARVPTESEVDRILAPWRPQRWRRAALYFWRSRDDEEVWLRTYYAQDSDEKFQKLRTVDEDCDPRFDEGFGEDSRPWTVLDDSVLFNGDWSAALKILPELTGPLPGYEQLNHRHLGDPSKLDTLRRDLRDSVASALRLQGEGNTAEQLKIDDVEAGPAGMELQVHVVTSFIFVVDKEACETDKLRLLFLDARGNIVRESRVPVTESWEMREAWDAKKFRDSNFWVDRTRGEWGQCSDPGSILGDKYGFSGEIGRVLYQVE